jgi:hypothetical protein
MTPVADHWKGLIFPSVSRGRASKPASLRVSRSVSHLAGRALPKLNPLGSSPGGFFFVVVVMR